MPSITHKYFLYFDIIFNTYWFSIKSKANVDQWSVSHKNSVTEYYPYILLMQPSFFSILLLLIPLILVDCKYIPLYS